MDAESSYLLQRVDCNCNDCRFMSRDLERKRSFDALHQHTPKAARINYGRCSLKDTAITWIAAVCQLDTQDCFVHRKDAVSSAS